MRSFFNNFQATMIRNIGRKQISVNQLAKDAGVSQAFLSRVLRGERNIASEEKIIQIAKALEIDPPDELVIELGRIPEGKEKLINMTMVFNRLDAFQQQKLFDMALDMDNRNKLQKAMKHD